MNRLSVLLAVALLGTSTAALAADPTQADFDACNKMAQSKVSSPSASPQGQPQTEAKGQPSAGATQAAPSPQPASEAKVENQANQLRGIADASKDDPGYQQAYRTCMTERGF